MNQDGIVLLHKKTGITSFVSLNSIKKALDTRKVGHTGTLDSFAKGLLVVCTGRLTKLAGNITEFSKTYKAVIQFGIETDTLEYTGNVIRSTNLPDEEEFYKALEKFKGQINQVPPVFSAIHVNGRRSSDLARDGKVESLPERQVTIFNSQVLEIKKNQQNLIEYTLLQFTVSKGTYIRSLARDIGKECNSSGTLIGLFRTAIGNFSISDAAGYDCDEPFTIDSVLGEMMEQKKLILEQQENLILHTERKPYIPDENELRLQKEIREKLQPFSEETALLCGFKILHIKSEDGFENFMNGKPLRSKYFDCDLHSFENDSLIAVFSINGLFAGLISKDENGRIHYKFVLN